MRRFLARGMAVGWALALLAVAGWVAKEGSMVGPEAMAAPAAGVEMRRDVVYGTGGGRDLKLTLFLPPDAKTRAPMPAMLFIHGGGWRGGNPDQFYGQSRLLAAQGIVCASIAYRLSGEAKYPAAVEDAKCAVRYLRANAKELNVDPNWIACGGGSAGGHLAAMLATTGGVAKLEGTGGHAGVSSRVCAAVLFNPVLDMAGFPPGGNGPTAVAAFLDAQPGEKPDLYKEASPIANASKETAPCLIFHGTADKTVPHAQAVRFKETLEKLGVPVELVSAEGMNHGFFNGGPWYDQSYQKMEAWLKERFGM